jgi:hypothetical protein
VRKPLRLEVNGESVRLYDSTAAAQYLGVSKATLLNYLAYRYLRKAGELNHGYVFTQLQLDECRQHLNLDRKEINVEYAKQ